MKPKIKIDTVAKDAMNTLKRMTITISPLGEGPDISELKTAFLEMSNGLPSNLTDVEAMISDRQAHLLDLGDAASEGSQHEDHFYQSIATRVDKIRELMAELDLKSEQVEDLEMIVAFSIHIGQGLAILELRKKHLGSVERSNKILQGSSAGGIGKEGKYEKETEEILNCMKEQVVKGHNILRAAHYAYNTKKLGKNPEANRSRYRFHLKKGTI